MRNAILVIAALGANALAIAARAADAPPPEVKKTVDALVGHWTLKGIDQEPGGVPQVVVNGTLDCKAVALGAAVNCLIVTDIGGTKVEAASVIGYSPDEQVVRWMEISSSGEYHDHRGVWKGSVIEFEPLTYTAGGVRMTERFTPGFPKPGMTRWRVFVETSQGTSLLQLSGTRAGK